MVNMGLELLLDPGEIWRILEQEDRTKPSENEVEEFKKQHIRRNYVRAVFASMEGMTFWIKKYAIEFNKRMVKRRHSRPIFTDREIEEMLEQKKYIKFEANIKLAFRQHSRIKNNGYRVDFGTEGWQKVLQGVKKRDQLMHPKSKADLQVSYEELDNVWQGFDWFCEQMDNAMKSHSACIRESGYD